MSKERELGKEDQAKSTVNSLEGADTTAWIVTFLILYIRFMFFPITAYSMFLQVVIIIILLVLSSDPEYFPQKFVYSRIAVLLVLAFTSSDPDEGGAG